MGLGRTRLPLPSARCLVSTAASCAPSTPGLVGDQGRHRGGAARTLRAASHAPAAASVLRCGACSLSAASPSLRLWGQVVG